MPFEAESGWSVAWAFRIFGRAGIQVLSQAGWKPPASNSAPHQLASLWQVTQPWAVAPYLWNGISCVSYKVIEDFNKSTVISLVLNILTSPGLSSVIKLITCDSQIDSIFFFCFFVAYKIMLGLKFDGILNLPDGHESVLQILKLQSWASPVKGQLLNFLSRSEAKSPVMARLSLWGCGCTSSVVGIRLGSVVR